MYSTVPDFVNTKMWDDFKQGEILLAIKTHRTADEKELPFFKGEQLTFIEQYGHKYCTVKNAEGASGFIPLSHVVYKEVFHDRTWFQPVCSRRMAERLLDKEKVNTFLLRYGKETGVFVISMKTSSSFQHELVTRHDSKYVFRTLQFDTLGEVANMLQRKHECSVFNFTLPEEMQRNENHTENTRCQILTGGLVVAKKCFRHKGKDPKYMILRREHRYNVLGITSDLKWYILKNGVDGSEGFVPVWFLSNITPRWYHGKQDIGYPDTILSKQKRNFTFLVTYVNSKYILCIRTCEGHHVQETIQYKNENVTCLNSTYGCIIELVNFLMSSPAVPMVKHPIPNSYYQSSSSSIEAANSSENIDLGSVEMYFNALDEGIENDYSIRIMLVGHHGAGKTTLARLLLNEPYDTTESTDGIEIHIKEACLDIKSGKWDAFTQAKDECRLEKRLETVIRQQSLHKSKHPHTDTVFDMQEPAEHKVERRHVSPRPHSYTPREYEKWANVPSTPDTTKSSNKTLFRKSACDLTWEQRKSIVELVTRGTSEIEGNTTCPISIWDFAGQFIFYATHQVFMSSRALYILVLDLSKPLDSIVEETDQPGMCSNKNKRTVSSFIELWMKSIHMKNEGDNSDLPAVLMVGTHGDKLVGDDKAIAKYIEEYFENVRKLFDESQLLKHIQPEQVCVDARNVDQAVKEIRQAVYEICRRLPWWGEEKPARWINLEQIIINLQQTQEIVDIETILAKNRESQMPVESEEEVRLFLRTHNNAGNVIYFENDTLENTVVLRPQWIVDAFRSIITSEQFCTRNTGLRKFRHELFTKGILREEFITELWKADAANKPFLEHMNQILLYMEILSITAKAKTYEGEELFYFVPSLLPQAALDITTITQRHRTHVLTFIVSQDYWHPPLFNAVLAALIGRWNVLKVGNEIKLTGSSGVFELDRSRDTMLVVTTDSHMINCYLANFSEKYIDNRKCDQVRRFIYATLGKQIGAKVDAVVELAITCSEPNVLPGSDNDNIFKCDLLAEEDCVFCHAHSAPHQMDTRRIMHDWFPDGFTTRHDVSCMNGWVTHVQAPEYVNDFPLTDRHLQALSLTLGRGWQHIGFSLGLSNAIIDQCQMDYPHKTEMQIYQMLKKWKENESKRGPVTFLKYVVGLCDNNAVVIDWDTVKNVGDAI